MRRKQHENNNDINSVDVYYVHDEHQKIGDERYMYLEERVEQLEQQIEELKAQRQSENYLTPAQFAEK